MHICLRCFLRHNPSDHHDSRRALLDSYLQNCYSKQLTDLSVSQPWTGCCQNPARKTEAEGRKVHLQKMSTGEKLKLRRNAFCVPRQDLLCYTVICKSLNSTDQVTDPLHKIRIVQRIAATRRNQPTGIKLGGKVGHRQACQ